MSTVTQRIPHLLSGISQQPDSKKFPGQVRNATNVYPEYALGLQKRPGAEYVATLEGATAGGKWFSILRDDTEKYVGQYDNNVFRMWDLTTGRSIGVDMSGVGAVPAACVYANLSSALDTYNSAKTVTATRLQELNASQAALQEVIAGQRDTERPIFEINYNVDFGDEGGIRRSFVRSGVLQDSQHRYTLLDDTVVLSGPSLTLPNGWRLGTEYTNEHPIVAAKGYRVFGAIQTVAATNDESDLDTAEADVAAAQLAYDLAVSNETTALNAYNIQVSNCARAAGPVGGYLTGATADDIDILTLADTTFVLNKRKTVQFNNVVESALENQALVVISIVSSDTTYTVIYNGTSYSYTTGSNPNVKQITDGLIAAMTGIANVSLAQVGNVIHIVNNAASFSIATTGSTSGNGLYAFQGEVAAITSLPGYAPDGYRVLIRNTADVDVDDMWVKFEASSGSGYGAGTWIESVGPGLNTTFDPLTMPHRLRREADGHFTFGPITWDQRIIGDENTNPTPSFVNNTIREMFLYRNRLGFLVNEGVVLSRAGDLFNFWNTTALTATDDDPIDISASTAKPVALNYVLPTTTGLVMFGKNEQFLLSTDSDILSPKTAKINTMSSYDCDTSIKAASSGNTQVFISKTNLFTKVFEAFDIRNDNAPMVAEATVNVPELLPQTINSFITSPALSLFSFGTTGGNELFQYRYYQPGDKREAASWYKWLLSGNLVLQFFDTSTLYAVVLNENANGDQVVIQRFSLRQSSANGFLQLPTGERTDVNMDMWSTNPYREYDEATDVTTIELPYATVGTGQATLLLLGDLIGGNQGLSNQSVGAVVRGDVTYDAATETYSVEIDGDYRGRDIVVGFDYEMRVDLPTFYIRESSGGGSSSDKTSSLIIHRLNVSTGLSGPVRYDVTTSGSPAWTNTVSVTLPNNYTLNSVNMKASSVHTVPVYQRNENTSVTIIGDTPFPVTLIDVTFEAKYNTRFYQRLG
jgi:hypothetical protein